MVETVRMDAASRTDIEQTGWAEAPEPTYLQGGALVLMTVVSLVFLAAVAAAIVFIVWGQASS